MILRKNQKTKLQKGLLVLTAMIVLANCTKERPQQWPDGVAEDVYEKSFLNSQTAQITLSTQITSQEDILNIQAMGEISDLKIEKVETDERLKAMFKDLHTFGSPGASYEVRFDVGVKKLTAFKVLSQNQLNEMPIMEQQIAVKKQSQFWIPIFEFSIDSQGVVEATKNDLGENTRTLKLTETNSDKATHIQLSTLVSRRLVVGVQESERESAKEIFLKSQIDGAIFTKEDLLKKLQINVSQSGKYLIKIGGEQLNLFRIQKFSDISEDLRQLILEQDKGGSLATQDVRRCTAGEKAMLDEATASDCVVVLSYEINAIAFVNAERNQLDREGTLSNSVSFTTVTKPETAQFIRISKDPTIRMVDKDEQVSRLDPRSTLILKEIKNLEFLMRRTMKDSPNTFSYTFAGASGGLEIVKFIPEDKQIRVLRADKLLNTDGSTVIDQETLMLIPARYFKVVNVDDKGNQLSQPRTVSAHWSEEEAIASLDWTANSIPTINSPLDFYGVEQCFSAISERKISEVDHRLSKSGMLNFTLTSTYAGNRGSFDCAGIEEAGYFDTVQKTFTFEERVSFKKYEKVGDESSLLNLPYQAQKTLGFGLFTYKKKVPNQNGLTHVDGTEIPLPSIFDIKKGKKVTYVLAGLPQGSDQKSKELRDAIIKSTKEVIADLNSAFQKALKGTEEERVGNVLELKIEGVDVDAGKLGDLDQNHIFFVQKATDSGVIGLGGSHANPRTGKVESASVYLYGGNMLSMVDSMRKLARAKDEYDARMSVKKLEQEVITGSETEETVSEEVVEASNENISTDVQNKVPNMNPMELQTFKRKFSQALNSLAVNKGIKKSSVLSSKQKVKSRVQNFGAMIQKLDPGVLRVENSDLKLAMAKLNKQQFAIASALNESLTQKNAIHPEKLKQSLFKHQNPDSQIRGESVKAKLRAANICLYDRGDFKNMLSGSMAGESAWLDTKSDLEILASVWKGTLAHEIGHNLGLRHNFESSYDKANWKFNENEETLRDYSSIMDYLTDDHITYDGMGPQDVIALRAAYGGVLDLDPRVLEFVEEDPVTLRKFIMSGAGVKTEVVDSKSVKIGDYLKAVGLKTWLDLSSQSLNALPIKVAKFCSDEDAFTRPTCNLFDKGSSPEEIVDNIIASYKERYSLSNFPNDRLVFNDYNLDGYIGRLFSQFIPIRQFLEETFYQAIVIGADAETINQHVSASIKGLLFFNELIRTPDAPAGIDGDARFVEVEKQIPREDGSGNDSYVFTVERKWAKSLASGVDSERLRVRGIEFDKTIATIMLSNRDFGFPRYEAAH